MTDGRCTCAPRRVVTEGLDASGEPFVAVDGTRVHARHELVEDGAGRLSLSIIPADWVGRVLVEQPDEPA
ncbi:hypothetical protein [Azospirillum baldaniorum]|nr:hypothetical protein [Azospirillum baldaniorum]TWA71899.1 hypothetical protein FBZ84_101165 [Azospirillum baldaniorum]